MRPSIASMPRTKVSRRSEATSGRRLDDVVGDGQDVGDRVDQQADDLVADLGDDDDMPRRRLGRLQAEPRGQVDDRQHGAAQIDDAAHEGRRVRQRPSPASSRGFRGPP